MAKILVYALNYAPEQIGVGRYTSDIAAYLTEAGHEVMVVTALPHYPEWKVASGYSRFSFVRERRAGMRVIRCPLVLKRPMRGIWRLLAPASFAVTSLPAFAWMMLRYRPDVVFCVEPTLFVAPAALAFSAMMGARSVLHVQDLEVDAAFAVGHLRGALAQRLARACENLLLRRFDQIITVSARMRERIAAKGVHRGKIALIRNWVDLDVIRPLQGRNAYRDEFGWSDALVVALYAGSMGPKQGLPVALDAARHLVGRSDILFVIAGEGPCKADLLARYAHLPNVRFLPQQPDARMCDFLNLADVHLLPQTRGVADLVLPSKLGGMLASGKPVLVTADEGTELFDVLSGTAIIVPPGDSDAMARELCRFADGARHHPGLGDGHKIVAEMSRATCLRRIAEHVPHYA